MYHSLNDQWRSRIGTRRRHTFFIRLLLQLRMCVLEMLTRLSSPADRVDGKERR